MVRTGLAAAIVVVASSALGAPQTRQQQLCLNALDAAAVKLVVESGKAIVACVHDAGMGRLPAGQTAEQCVTADDGGLVAKAMAAVTAAERKSCAALPDFGARSAADVNGAFTPTLSVHDLFGPDLDAALVSAAADDAGFRCQLALATSATKIVAAKVRAFAACTAAGLRDGTIDSAVALRSCYGAAPAGKVTKAVAKAQTIADKKCAGLSLPMLFPGKCANAPLASLYACVEPQVQCSVCLALNAAEHAAKGCHTFVDGVAAPYCGDLPVTTQSIARQWDEQILNAIRHDTPRPVIHSRNLFHLSAAMWDAWRAYGGGGSAFLTDESHVTADPAHDRRIAISFAAYRVLSNRYALSPNAALSQAAFDAKMAALGYDTGYTSTDGDAPAAVGNRIAAAIVAYGMSDGSNQQGNYADPNYTPVNQPLIVKQPGTTMADPNRWQPLALDFIVTQNGIPLPDKVQTAIGTRWNQVKPFALTRSDPDALYIDPGPPPRLGTATDGVFKQSAVRDVELSSWLTPDDPTTIDISPGAYGNNPLGTNDGTGRPVNPFTGQPYASQVVRRGDFGRVLAEFWADGPNSETPPGHWNVLANYVSDHPTLGVKRIGGSGPLVDDLEWDVKLYLAVNGAVHDAGIVAWGLKHAYDSVRPISMIRYMGGLGQSSDSGGPSYDPNGLPLVPGLIEVITAASTQPGQRHEALAGHEGEIAILAWPGQPVQPTTQYSGVRWIRAVEWVPYQKSTFVTPAFPAYTSGHSTFSRSAAEVLTGFTGSAYFPGGLGEYVAPANEYLTFEQGPTTEVRLQWATYFDASDQAGQSRLWGGIHVSADDFTGRTTGSQIGQAAWAKAQQYYAGTAGP